MAEGWYGMVWLLTKGKERKGKERKGKERKGERKEKKGKAGGLRVLDERVGYG